MRSLQLFVNRKIGYDRHQQSGGGDIHVAEEFGAVAVVRSPVSNAADARVELPARVQEPSLAERAESGVQFISRWAGILAFAGTVAAIIWLLV
ncbi:hypothetical protein [Sphingobium bisphenolivorans]|uniref:hypothetical protein n=1 Tax=Sphingobium bisphenolivorans TaxID=1335760 RepID=UPI00126A2215|nr:hypothetical protein [Sphingobium bisphenolivorans]